VDVAGETTDSATTEALANSSPDAKTVDRTSEIWIQAVAAVTASVETADVALVPVATTNDALDHHLVSIPINQQPAVLIAPPTVARAHGLDLAAVHVVFVATGRVAPFEAIVAATHLHHHVQYLAH